MAGSRLADGEAGRFRFLAEVGEAGRRGGAAGAARGADSHDDPPVTRRRHRLEASRGEEAEGEGGRSAEEDRRHLVKVGAGEDDPLPATGGTREGLRWLRSGMLR